MFSVGNAKHAKKEAAESGGEPEDMAKVAPNFVGGGGSNMVCVCVWVN